ncbi:MAG: 16S rRNA (cytosine(1402)-N(4))-methyltransferase RsmH [Patescibacteria group bacterium]
MSHTPVLLQETIDCLDPEPGEFFIDGTANGGGHSKEILKAISPDGTLLCVDWDEVAIKKATKEVQSRNATVIFANENYAELPSLLKKKKLPKANGLLLDLGFSSDQLNISGRGFSFLEDEPLYMTYSEKSKPVAEIIRELKEDDLADVIFKLSGERLSRKIAKAIKEASKRKRITSSLELAEVIRKAVGGKYEAGRINPATRTFQALRIFANKELENLERVLSGLGSILAVGGRIAIISFHSIEDSLVKEYFKKMAQSKKLVLINKKPIEASENEVMRNPRSRSARLRAAIIN